MGPIDLRESDLVVDLESGGTTSEEDESRDIISGGKKKLLGKFWSGGDGVCSRNSVLVSAETSVENVEILTDKLGVECVEKKLVKEKRKKTPKKPPKPPLPPRGPSLDAADMKLVREISELAILKRARVERMKALKKTRADKASSSINSLFAMIITVLFCFVIIYQGVCSRSSSSVSSHRAPESASVARDIMIQSAYLNNPSSSFPNYVEQVSGAGQEEETHSVAE